MIKIILVEPGEDLPGIVAKGEREQHVIALPGTHKLTEPITEWSIQGLDQKRSCKVGPYRVTIEKVDP